MPVPPALTKRVALGDLRRWAQVSGDHNPLHTDEGYARGTRYGRPIAHGHLTITWLMQWAYEWRGPEWVRSGRVEGLRYRAPVYADTDYRVAGEPDAGNAAVAVIRVVGPDGTVAVEAHLRVAAAVGETGTPTKPPQGDM